MTTTPISLLSIIAKVIVYQATYSLAWTQYALMRSNLVLLMTTNCTVSLSMGFFIFAVLTIKDPENGKLWKLRKTKH